MGNFLAFILAFLALIAAPEARAQFFPIPAGAIPFGDTRRNLRADATNLLWDDTDNQITLGAGSASKPAYSFVGSGLDDNGMYRSGTDEISFATAGTQRFKITSSGIGNFVGNLCVGAVCTPNGVIDIVSTANNGAKLDIAGDATSSVQSAAEIRFFDASSGNNVNVRLQDSSVASLFTISGGTSGANTNDWLTIARTTGVTNVLATTASTTSGTGALVVAGGVGLAGNLNAGGIIGTTATTASTSQSTGALVVAGGAGIGGNVVTGGVSISGGIDVASAATITAMRSDYSWINVTGSTATALQGITAGIAGQHLWLYTDGADVTLANLNGGASAANQIKTNTGADVVITAPGSVHLMYIGTISKWVVMGDTAP